MATTTTTKITTPLRYQDTPETTAHLNWADLISLNLSIFDQPGGKQQLATQLRTAIHTIGFFYITNFGLTPSAIDSQFHLCNLIMDLPLSEKMTYVIDPSLPGGPLGYKPAGRYPLGDSGLRDNVEFYDDPKWNAHFRARSRPQPVVDAAAETEAFARHMHHHVLYRLLVLVGIIMELEDEEALWKMHGYERMSNCHLRYMRHVPRTEEENDRLERKGGMIIPGHTDFGTFTFLFRQPVAALQVRAEEGEEWKWVRPVMDAVVVNVADTISFLTGGYLKSSTHRVVTPPPDQRHIPRTSVIYFSRPDDETPLKAVDSPVIRREGDKSKAPPGGAITAGDWVSARYKDIYRLQQNAKEDVEVVIKEIEAGA
ncbi:2OG-Fe(II) oxygenase superfamily protein [Saccharata proteae CBS 121410]|uniref:2OG-Fe(II) oxygenase superfamily protein n=1 Tax=Saccharata proteae CBS 121410 TaxID=1314787 RepID=A0A9P4HWW6_9PEZI|nr:2OG-Fe(II) oxygenase superfamily protein [Saccharata proteae CBS 121410]